MPGYVITAVFEVEGGKIRLGRDVLSPWWGRGHRFSYCDGRTLTLVVEVAAPGRSQAFESVLGRVEGLWTELGGDPLPPPSTVRLQTVLPEEKVVAGAVGRGPDGVIAEATARLTAQLRATRSALGELEGRLGSWPGRAGRPGPRTLPPDEPPDDGGLAGTREPRRPRPGPGPVAETLDEPAGPPSGVDDLLPPRR